MAVETITEPETRLEVFELREGGEDYVGHVYGVYVKGHVEPEEFHEAVERWATETYGSPPSLIQEIRRATWRAVPVGRVLKGYFNLMDATPGTKGAFPVTWAHVTLPADL